MAGVAGGLVSASVWPWPAWASPAGLVTKPIPSSGEALPAIGMGTWRTFNVGDDQMLRDARTRVLRAFLDGGGQVIDSSPMYGSSQAVVGYGLEQLGASGRVFSAEKVWTSDGDETREDIAASADEWRTRRFDLMQVHNLLAWQSHLPTLRAMKDAGEVRYIGITTSDGRRHGEFERIMKSEPVDFIQLTYNMIDREAENRLLPLAGERGIAVMVNRPFRGGSLVDRFQGRHPLPEWAAEIGCRNWPQFLLKFIVSHPAVTCAIPATTRVEHMREDMGAARGPMPDAGMRRRMLDYVASL
ncbi:MAG: aldo/keto reductase [Halofilum sp. (in: g-proteobacteria)]